MITFFYNRFKIKGIQQPIQLSPHPSPIPLNSPTPAVTPLSSPSVFNYQTPGSQSSSSNISDFKYPNSTEVNSSGNTLNLQSSDDPKNITDWYKNKIKDLNMNAKSFITTTTNGNVLNKLVGSNGKKEVRVDIEKSTASNTTNIAIVLINS